MIILLKMSNYYRSITNKPNNRQIPNRLLIVNHPKWQQWMPFVCCLFSKTARKCHTTTEQQTRRDHTHKSMLKSLAKDFWQELNGGWMMAYVPLKRKNPFNSFTILYTSHFGTTVDLINQQDQLTRIPIFLERLIKLQAATATAAHSIENRWEC